MQDLESLASRGAGTAPLPDSGLSQDPVDGVLDNWGADRVERVPHAGDDLEPARLVGVGVELLRGAGQDEAVARAMDDCERLGDAVDEHDRGGWPRPPRRHAGAEFAGGEPAAWP